LRSYRRPDRADEVLARLERVAGRRVKLMAATALVAAESPLLLWPTLTLWAGLRRRPADLVILNNGYSTRLITAARLSRRIRSVVVHARDFPEFGRMNPVPAAWPMIVANSTAVRRSFLALGAPEERVKVIYNPFDYERNFKQVVPIEDEPWTMRSGTRVALVASLEPWKGHELFLEAARMLCGRRRDLFFYVVGGEGASSLGRLRRLQGLVDVWALHDRVEFLGRRIDIDRVMRSMDIIAHTSISPEPFGNVVVEGMLLGRAVVAAGEGGPTEIVTNGVDGVLVTPRNAEALAEAIAMLADQPELRRRLGERGVESARARFSPSAFREAILGVYGRALIHDDEVGPPAGPSR
jgi:glycosyltransferase involved in cell wall biosynthesis